MAPPNHSAQDGRVNLPSRRALLGAGLAGGAAVLAGCDSDDDARAPAATATASATEPSAEQTASARHPTFDPQDWDSVQAQFPLDPALAQFAAFVLSPHTRVLDAAIAGYRDELGVDTERRAARGPRPRGGGARRRPRPTTVAWRSSTPSPTAPRWASA